MNADAVMVGSILGVVGTVVVLGGIIFWAIRKINQDSEHTDL